MHENVLQIVFVELLHLIDGIPEPLIDLRGVRELVQGEREGEGRAGG